MSQVIYEVSYFAWPVNHEVELDIKNAHMSHIFGLPNFQIVALDILNCLPRKKHMFQHR
jgi:hypothetical protein